MTNAEKILALLFKTPGLDDDEISSQAEVFPRQQVNQICKRLESTGQLKRALGPLGKIVNYPTIPCDNSTKNRPIEAQPYDSSINRPKQKAARTSAKKSQMHTPELDKINLLKLSRSLILIPCSGKKLKSTKVLEGPSIKDFLPSSLTKQLEKAREAMAHKSNLDESSLLPGWMRYDGTLYQNAQNAIERTVIKGQNLIILSGGYGILLANEPIGYYERVFKSSDWPKGLLEKVLLEYIRAKGIENVVAITSVSTGYRALLNRINWHDSKLQNVFLLAPEPVKGALSKAPQAEGEALSALLNGDLNSSFKSSHGLRMTVRTIKMT